MYKRTFHRWKHDVALVALLLAGCLLACGAIAGEQPEVTVTAGGAGSVVPVRGWLVQSTALAQQDGNTVSTPGYSTQGWYAVGPRTTVLAGLLENHVFTDVFHGSRLRGVGIPHGRGAFQIPWWYRSTFAIAPGVAGVHTYIRINGIIPDADVWVNGMQVASRHEVAGAYTTHVIDVTRLVHAGTNVIAIRVYPASPQRDFSQGWIDWNPAPPDNNMGIWRDVDIVRSGAVSVHDLHVLTKLELPGMAHAAITLKADVRNDSGVAQDVVVDAHVAGIALHRTVHLAAHQARTVTFSPATDRMLVLRHPRVWWPAPMGDQPLYQATLTLRVGNVVSDRAATTFGIRDVTSHLTKEGYRQFVINGTPLMIRGAGWAPDMFLRDDPQRLEAQFRYIRNLGLNAIRTEGKLERPDFYRLADREGILILAGWECCDKWEAWAGTGGEPWDAPDLAIARASMASEARRLRDHPSVIAFLIGSDNAPPPQVAAAYVDALHAADWPDPIISAASAQKTALAGPSGMKMSGPYGWVPPGYWYADQVGGAFGFNSETGAGIDMPRVASLRRMLPARDLEALWKDPDVRQYHAAPFWSPFSSLKSFDTALAHRYGHPTSLVDYVKKAQLANYANVRAQFEAYAGNMNATNPATGVIYWMLTNAWPSLHWHLFGYDLNPAGAYFGAQKANEAVHIQYAPDDRAIMGINHTRQAEEHLSAHIRVRDLDGSVRYQRQLADISLAPNHATRLAIVPAVPGLSSVYFVELDLRDAHGAQVSRNVYWLPREQDQLDWPKSNWYMTPVTRYANLTALQTLPPATVTLGARTRRDGDHAITTVVVTAAAASKAVALLVHLSMHRGAGGAPVLPVTWSSNDVTLWPGESITLTARYPVAGSTSPVVQVDGWNVQARSIPASTPETTGGKP